MWMLLLGMAMLCHHLALTDADDPCISERSCPRNTAVLDSSSLLAVQTVMSKTHRHHHHHHKTSPESKLVEHADVKGMHVRAHHETMPAVVWRSFEAIAEQKRELLEKGSSESAHPYKPDMPGNVFEAVEVSLPLEPPILKHPREVGAGQDDKNIVGLHELTRGGRQCIVYGMGIADDSNFEQQMQQLGCETHAFDCTVDPASPAVNGKSFKFHHWCIGHKNNVSFEDNTYVKTDENKLQFKTLPETMKELGHSYIDLLKFDIEGFEWPLFEHQILTSPNPPEQLSFELHTQKANPAYVPQENVHDKGYVQVNQLFRSLFDMGYRVTSKELNSGDPACAEFVAVKVNRDD